MKFEISEDSLYVIFDENEIRLTITAEEEDSIDYEPDVYITHKPENATEALREFLRAAQNYGHAELKITANGKKRDSAMLVLTASGNKSTAFLTISIDLKRINTNAMKALQEIRKVLTSYEEGSENV